MNTNTTLRVNSPITLNNGRFTTSYNHTFIARKAGYIYQINQDGTYLVRFGRKAFSCPPSAVKPA